MVPRLCLRARQLQPPEEVVDGSQPAPRVRLRSVADLLPEDSGAERGRCLCLHPRHDVLVDGHGEGDAAVAETLADHLGMNVLLEQDRGVRVAEVV